MSIPTVGVIGSGLSGLCAAIQVKKRLGITAHIFEASEDLGGTWNHNTYPGCACDVDSHVYSYSFAKNPNWSEKYSGNAEIKEYIRDVANRFDVYDNIQFKTSVVSATWLEDQNKWKIDWTQNGQPIQSSYFDYVFAGLGPLRVPHIPKQFKAFQGTVVHTSSWDSSIDFTNKRVAVIGAGASAIQAIPQLVKVVASLDSYQRTSPWIIDRIQIRFPLIVKLMFAYIPFTMLLYRAFVFFLWECLYVLMGYPESRSAKLISKFLKYRMVKRLTNKGRADLVPVLVPNYIPGCKRAALSDTYLEALCEDNVRINCSPIKSIVGRSITTEDDETSEYDILCLATGFKVTGLLGELQITGRDNRSLNDMWNTSYPKTYKSVGIHGFPNFFMLAGPASILGHNSVIFMIEQQVNLAVNSIKYAQAHNLVAMEPTVEAQDKFVNELLEDYKGTAWATGCDSWYMNEKGEIFALWSGTATSFWWKLRGTNYGDDYIKYSNVEIDSNRIG
ncbi:putative flavoprotein [Phycomyces nitens]|nr:putative flavoprotein [Phycomyces nitens]